jgi:hypothetical protein
MRAKQRTRLVGPLSYLASTWIPCSTCKTWCAVVTTATVGTAGGGGGGGGSREIGRAQADQDHRLRRQGIIKQLKLTSMMTVVCFDKFK